MRELLKTLADNYKVAILITAKNLSEVEEICDTIAVIDNGMIVFVKTYNELLAKNEPYTKLCVTTPSPNLTAMTIEQSFGYKTNLCGSDVIVDTHPENARAIYDELKTRNIQVFGMSKVNKSIQEQFYKLVQRRRGRHVQP
jgi:ABC-2 type transport system ATP-binding protein